MTYSEAIQMLYNLRLFGAKFGLDNTFKLAGLCGHPHRHLDFIHVAGTNGKGSTCAMLESMYRAAGMRVGLFTSPHLVTFGERIQVNRQPIPEAEVVRLAIRLQSLLRQFPESAHPTFFEVITVMALIYFAEQECDLVVWETGLGGRLDATNIVTPLASVITNVQLDHQQWLGNTLPQIAMEKAGIIKRGIPVLTAAAEPSALEVITRTAKDHRAPLTVVTQEDTRCAPLNELALPLLGEHQQMNAALALAAVRILAGRLPLSGAVIRIGLSQVDWPGRFQLIRTAQNQTYILDGAHNPAGAETLRAAFLKHFPNARPTLIVGIFKDKDWTSICQILAPLAGRLLLVPVHSERTATPEALQAVCGRANPTAEVVACSSLAEAMIRADQAPLVVLTGSLYLVGEALENLRIMPAMAANERGLNEWNNSSSMVLPLASYTGR